MHLPFCPKRMDLRQVVRILNHFCVPHLADTWDNVGLLVQPSAPFAVSRILVTNDLTEPVLSEALKLETNLILSYHPPVFSPLKRITTDCHWKERLVVTCLENRIAVYSPHTGLDAKVNGVNDWLLSPFGEYQMRLFESLEFFTRFSQQKANHSDSVRQRINDQVDVSIYGFGGPVLYYPP